MRWGGLVVAGCSDEAETFADRARRDQVARVERNDPHMAAAMRKARESLADFLTLARPPRPTTPNFAVKMGIPAEGDNTESFWIEPFAQRGSKFSGRINNTPRIVKTVKLGQAIEFPKMKSSIGSITRAAKCTAITLPARCSSASRPIRPRPSERSLV